MMRHLTMAPPRKQRRTGAESPSQDCEVAFRNASSVTHREAKTQLSSTSQITSALDKAKNRANGRSEVSLAQEAQDAAHDGASDVVSAINPEEYSCSSGTAVADITAFAAKWTPLLKAEAALIAWDVSTCVEGGDTLTNATSKTQKESLKKIGGPSTSGTEMDVRSDTVAACNSSRSFLVGDDDAKALDVFKREERTSCGLFELWEFCCAYMRKRRHAFQTLRLQGNATDFCDATNDDPRDALRGVGLRLTGPYDLLAGELPLGKRALLAHSRGFYDLPECQPVVCACSPQFFRAGPVPAAAPTCASHCVPTSPSSLFSPEMRPCSGTSLPLAASPHSFASTACNGGAAAGSSTAITLDSARGSKRSPRTAPAGGSRAVFNRQSPATAAEGAAHAAGDFSLNPSHWMLGAWRVPADYHLCLFRDKEEEIPHAVVANAPSEGPAFSVVAAACSSEALAGKAAARKGATPLSEQCGDETVPAAVLRKYSNKEINVPVHTTAAREDQHKGPHNGDTEKKLGGGTEESEDASEAEGKSGRSRGGAGCSSKGLVVKEGQQCNTVPINAAHEKTFKEVPLLLAAVLLHCQAIRTAYNEASQKKNNRSTPWRSSKQRQQLTLKEEQQRRNNHAVGTASANSRKHTSSQAEEMNVDCFVLPEAVRLQRELLAWLRRCTVPDVLRSIEENTRRWHRWRAKVSICSDFSGLGVVAPYDKTTEKGYRALCSDTDLKKIVKNIKLAAPAERNTQRLEELIALAGIAVDESDVGTALQLGRNLFLADAPGEKTCRLIRPATLLLKSAYTVLEEPYFAEVTEACVGYRLSC